MQYSTPVNTVLSAKDASAKCSMTCHIVLAGVIKVAA